MNRKRQSITTAPEIIESITERTKMNLDLQVKLVHWLAEHEKAQRKFRFAIISKVSRIESALSLLLVGQMAQTQGQRQFFTAEKLRADAEGAEEFISKRALEGGQKIVKYIYQEEQIIEVRHDRRRKWHGWEI